MKRLLPILVLPFLVANASANAGPGPWANGAYYPGQLDGRYSANVYNNTQARFDADEMNPPSGNRRFSDTITASTNTSFVTNVTITVTNIGGLVVTNSVTNISSVTTTNFTLVNSGAANVVSGVLGFALRNGTPTATLSGSGGTSAGGATGGTSSGGSTTPGTGTSGTAQGGTVENIGLDNSHNYFVIYVNGDVFAGKTAAGINLDTKRVAGSLWNGVGGLTYQVVTNITGSSDLTNSTFGSRTEVLGVPTATAGGYFNAKIKNSKTPFVFKGAGAISVNYGDPVEPSSTFPFNVDGIKSSDNSISAYSLTGRNAP